MVSESLQNNRPAFLELVDLFSGSSRFGELEGSDVYKISAKINPSDFSVPSKDEIIATIKKTIPLRDAVVFDFKIENGTPVSFHSQKEESIVDFLEEIQLGLDVNDSPVSFFVSLEINKVYDKVLSIYSIDSFFKIKGDGEVWPALHRFQQLKAKGIQRFEILDLNFGSFRGTETFQFYKTSSTPTESSQKKEGKGIRQKLQDHCHVLLEGNVNLTPFDFDISPSPICTPIESLFLSLKGVLSLVYLSDITSKNAHNFKCTIKGYKTINAEFSRLSDLSKDNSDLLFGVFEWVYAGSNRVSDRFTTARSVISLYADRNLLAHSLNDEILKSIKHTYAQYLKDDINNYLALKSRVVDELREGFDQASDIANTIVRSFAKSFVAMISVAFSFIVIRVMSKSTSASEAVLTMEFVYVLYAAFVVLALILLYNIWDSSVILGRFKERYETQKKRLNGILPDGEMIDEMYGFNSEFKKNVTFIEAKNRLIRWLWVISLAVILAVAVSLHLNMP